jgi:serine/threonine protein kinase
MFNFHDKRKKEMKDMKQSMLFKDMILFKKYKVLEKIGEGSFGLVFMGNVLNSSDLVAIKFEPKNLPELILEKETYFLYYLRGYGIPEVITFGHNAKYNILVQTLLGSSIADLFLQRRKYFSMKDCCMIGIQMIDRLEYIHSKYVIHRDVKPDNFLIGLEDASSLIYLIDFGLAKKYMSSRTGKHVNFRINKKWSGTSRFASANSLRGVIQSRRDDLESLCYVLLYLMKGVLPWDKIFGKTLSQDLLLIYRLKKYMKPEVLFSNLPKETKELFVYCKKLDFEIKPDYNYMRSLLLKILNDINEKNDLKFSWTNRNGNDLLNRQDSKKFLKYSYKRKNSPHQRIYNLILNNQKSKDNILLNSTNLEKEMNKAKKDCQPVINISLSPEKENGSFQGEKMKQKINQMSEIMIKYNTQNENDKENIVKKPINKNINNFVKKQIENNIIVKSQTENYLIKSQNEENNQKNYKKINQINKLRKNLIRNKHPKFIFKNDTFYDNNKNFLNPLLKNIIIKDNKSFNLESNQYKDNQNKEDNILKINIINSCKNNLLTNSLFEDNSYSQKRHNKKNKNIIIENNHLNNIKNDKK